MWGEVGRGRGGVFSRSTPESTPLLRPDSRVEAVGDALREGNGRRGTGS